MAGALPRDDSPLARGWHREATSLESCEDSSAHRAMHNLSRQTKGTLTMLHSEGQISLSSHQRADTITHKDDAIKPASCLVVLVDRDDQRVGVHHAGQEPAIGQVIETRDGRRWLVEVVAKLTQVAGLFRVVVSDDSSVLESVGDCLRSQS